MVSPDTEIGVGYRSHQEVDLDGTFNVGLGGTFQSTASLELPDLVTVGIRHRLNLTTFDRWRVMAGYEWSNWSRFDTVVVTGGPAPVPLPFDYNDGHFFSLGAEYMNSDATTLRAGVAWEESPLDDALCFVASQPDVPAARRRPVVAVRGPEPRHLRALFPRPRLQLPDHLRHAGRPVGGRRADRQRAVRRADVDATVGISCQRR